jgi:hypothetical protein
MNTQPHSKSDERRISALQSVSKENPKYRYFCERCTGAAFQSVEKVAPTLPRGHALLCVTCLQPVELPIKEENFITL